MRSVVFHPIILAAVVQGWLLPGAALAQVPTPPPAGEARRAAGFLTEYGFHLNMSHLGSDSERFVWDADFGGDVDVLDYGVGRVNLLGNYEAVLGEEFRRFDVNQGNYTLDVLGTARLAPVEIGVLFHHVSRHLSDRPKRFPIDWNMLGVQAMKAGRAGRLELAAHARALWTLTRSFVDYESELSGGVRGVYALHPHLSVTGGASLAFMGVERTEFGRGAQSGGLVDLGVRFDGERGAVEFFVAVERRIDADPLQHRTETLPQVGFRLLGR